MVRKAVIILVMAACLLWQAEQCFCDVGCTVEAEPADACADCCHSEQEAAQDDAGSCGCTGCDEAKPPVEAVSTSSPVPELKISPTVLPITCLTPARELQGTPCVAAAERPPAPPAYLLFEILLT